jgi:hypothetical protein
MCLKNHPSGMMNGEIFTVRDFDPARGILLDGSSDWIGDPWFEWLSPDGKQPRRCVPFALGYAITVHKAQGSEWPNVLVLDKYTGADRPRWLYTAVPHASAAVCIVPPAETLGPHRGRNSAWPDATPAPRAAVWKEHSRPRTKQDR